MENEFRKPSFRQSAQGFSRPKFCGIVFATLPGPPYNRASPDTQPRCSWLIQVRDGKLSIRFRAALAAFARTVSAHRSHRDIRVKSAESPGLKLKPAPSNHLGPHGARCEQWEAPAVSTREKGLQQRNGHVGRNGGGTRRPHDSPCNRVSRQFSETVPGVDAVLTLAAHCAEGAQASTSRLESTTPKNSLLFWPAREVLGPPVRDKFTFCNAFALVASKLLTAKLASPKWRSARRSSLTI